MNFKRELREKLISIKINKYRKQGMVIGENCKFTKPVFTVGEPYLVELGNNVWISFGVTFLTHDGAIHSLDKNVLKDNNVLRFGKIKIGNNCFIGCRSIIMPNVQLGDNCVVGAGAVVTKSFPSNSIIGGNPAKLITTTQEYTKKCLNEMPDVDMIKYRENKRKEVLRHYNEVTR